jgi:hypothetical protein
VPLLDKPAVAPVLRFYGFINKLLAVGQNTRDAAVARCQIAEKLAARLRSTVNYLALQSQVAPVEPPMDGSRQSANSPMEGMPCI